MFATHQTDPITRGQSRLPFHIPKISSPATKWSATVALQPANHNLHLMGKVPDIYCPLWYCNLSRAFLSAHSEIKIGSHCALVQSAQQQSSIFFSIFAIVQWKHKDGRCAGALATNFNATQPEKATIHLSNSIDNIASPLL